LIGLGCMRLPEDEDVAAATLEAALDAGITLFDTARAYDGNEQLLVRALRGTPARVITKGGMRRDGGLWLADGRAKSLRADCEASLDALDGLPVELYLVHAPDPRTPWATTVRALARLADDGLVTRVGVSNVNRKQLDEAVELAPVAAVEIAVSPFDDKALRGGVVDRCAELGIEVIAHSPLGGPRRAPALARQPALVAAAEAHDATPAEVVLAWLLALGVVPIPGARNPQAARSAARAASLRLDPEELPRLDHAFGRDRRSAPQSGRAAGAEVVLVMGTPGAGKTRIAEQYATDGYRRLNRDERGGSLRDLAAALDDELAEGARRVVLDNTYLSRAERSRVVEIVSRHGGSVHCVWLDTPLAQAQVNLVERLLDRFGRLPEPEELRSLGRREPGLLLPTSQMRAFRELEPPERDEGFASVERIAFVREARPGRAGVFVAAAAMRGGGWTPRDQAPQLLFDWLPNGDAGALAELAARLPGAAEVAVCPHGGGPPACWCRPPLPGLLLAFARAHDVDPARSRLVGTSAAHRTLAATLGAEFVSAE
jgi:diketogulonate reductase-like aldo/keto reductase/predicted kinase